MSDSESDFAYESAGEDAELEDNGKSVPSKGSADSVTNENDKSTEIEKAPVIAGIECVKDQVSDLTKEAESLTVHNKSMGDVQDNLQCLENASQKVSNNKTSNANGIAPKDTSHVGQDKESKRVKLRLEKKCMEKSQASSNKVSPDVSLSESPSAPTAVEAAEERVQNSWGWSSWGTSFLSTAATSVTTFTSQVSQGIGTVLETVETTLGAPPPEELAASLTEKETSNSSEITDGTDATKSETDEGKVPTTSLFSGVTSLTKVIENTGTKVIMGGLDTLELIGKKTIDILTEGDPGLRNKRAALSEGLTLSQVLRDAQNVAEGMKANESEETQEAILYTSFFDEFQGLVHLEALEMLSKQCQSKIASLQNTVSTDAAKKSILQEIEDICKDIPLAEDTTEEENPDFVKQLSEHMEALHLPLNSRKLEQVLVAASEVIHLYKQQDDKTDVRISREIYRHAISCLAQFTAVCVEHFHKISELILVQPEVQTYIVHYTKHLTELTSVLSIEIGSLASKFCECLNSIPGDEDHDSVTSLITSVYLEASNSTTYIQDAFQLLIPVLQLTALQ